ncbi:MAG TPA: hypothetical protein VMN56_21800 [Casimicrobiaceae bacterium]|nr:hypothetical protein [Casimicrobiaceae bacterium]
MKGVRTASVSGGTRAAPDDPLAAAKVSGEPNQKLLDASWPAIDLSAHAERARQVLARAKSQ